MAEIASTTFSQTDSSNTGALPGLSGTSNPNQIDDSIRALMGAVKREHDWRNGVATFGGSLNAYTITLSVAPTAYYSGQRFMLVAGFAATGSATVNVNALGAKTIKKLIAGAKTDIASGDIASGDYVDLLYDGTDLVWVNRGSTSYTVNAQTGETSVDSADSLGGYDASATAERKFTVANVFKSVNTLTEDTAPDVAADFALTYDASGTAAKKVKLQNMAVAVVGTHSNLKTLNNTSTPNSKMDITADEVFLKGSGIPYLASSVSVTVDITASGANGLDTGSEASSTWYYLWLIYNGTTVAGLLSTSATAPTMPATYTHKALVGCVRNDVSSNFVKTASIGNRIYQAPQKVMSAVVIGTAKTFQSVSISAGVPAAAMEVWGIIGESVAVNVVYGISPSSNMEGVQQGHDYENGIFLTHAGDNYTGWFTFSEVPLITAQTLWWTVTPLNSGAPSNMVITGFTLPIGA